MCTANVPWASVPCRHWGVRAREPRPSSQEADILMRKGLCGTTGAETENAGPASPQGGWGRPHCQRSRLVCWWPPECGQQQPEKLLQTQKMAQGLQTAFPGCFFNTNGITVLLCSLVF